MLAFHDIHPVAPVHFMVIPKRHIASLADATMDDAGVLGRIMALTGRLAREQGSPDGFRTIVNTGRIGRQDVYAPACARDRRTESARSDDRPQRGLTEHLRRSTWVA